MTTLVFGATGQLGTQLVHALKHEQQSVVTVSRAQCDFSQATSADISALIAKHQPKHVVNAAAFAAVDQAENHQALATRVNAEVPEWIAAAAFANKAHYVQYSTDYVFDGEHGASYAETMPTHPINHYGFSKREGELRVLSAHRGAYILRLQLLYDVVGNSFFHRIRAAMEQQKQLHVVADQLASPTPVEDVVQATLAFLSKPSIAAGIYHVSSSGFTSRHGFACAIRDELLARRLPCVVSAIEPVVSEQFPSIARRPKDVRLNTEKLASVGITMPHWRDGLKRVMERCHAAS